MTIPIVGGRFVLDPGPPRVGGTAHVHPATDYQDNLREGRNQASRRHRNQRCPASGVLPEGECGALGILAGRTATS